MEAGAWVRRRGCGRATGEWRDWWWVWRCEHRAAGAARCHVEGRGSAACGDGASEEELRWIGWCWCVPVSSPATVMKKYRGGDVLSNRGEDKRISPRRASLAASAPLLSTHGTRNGAVTPPGSVPAPCRSPEALGELRGCWSCATGSGGFASSGTVVAASSSTSSEARGRRTGATAGNAGTTVHAASRMAHQSPENPLELLQETTEVAGKGGFGIERNGASHLTLHVR
uniref:Uncharacterized protein n=1 Tax=Oryza punctata TaxID=4537 RepID=A0A0E0L352_ORYPU